jgi:hypothetical protein
MRILAITPMLPPAGTPVFKPVEPKKAKEPNAFETKNWDLLDEVPDAKSTKSAAPVPAYSVRQCGVCGKDWTPAICQSTRCYPVVGASAQTAAPDQGAEWLSHGSEWLSCDPLVPGVYEVRDALGGTHPQYARYWSFAKRWSGYDYSPLANLELSGMEWKQWRPLRIAK